MTLWNNLFIICSLVPVYAFDLKKYWFIRVIRWFDKKNRFQIRLAFKQLFGILIGVSLIKLLCKTITVKTDESKCVATSPLIQTVTFTYFGSLWFIPTGHSIKLNWENNNYQGGNCLANWPLAKGQLSKACPGKNYSLLISQVCTLLSDANLMFLRISEAVNLTQT